jgi:hypothetical protein
MVIDLFVRALVTTWHILRTFVLMLFLSNCQDTEHKMGEGISGLNIDGQLLQGNYGFRYFLKGMNKNVIELFALDKYESSGELITNKQNAINDLAISSSLAGVALLDPNPHEILLFNLLDKKYEKEILQNFSIGKIISIPDTRSFIMMALLQPIVLRYDFDTKIMRNIFDFSKEKIEMIVNCAISKDGKLLAVMGRSKMNDSSIYELLVYSLHNREIISRQQIGMFSTNFIFKENKYLCFIEIKAKKIGVMQIGSKINYYIVDDILDDTIFDVGAIDVHPQESIILLSLIDLSKKDYANSLSILDLTNGTVLKTGNYDFNIGFAQYNNQGDKIYAQTNSGIAVVNSNNLELDRIIKSKYSHGESLESIGPKMKLAYFK